MIFIKPKIHDSNTLEFKVGFVPQDGVTYNDFSMNTWIFIPEVLDVNKHTYTKDTFYCDILSHLRLITPSYPDGLDRLAPDTTSVQMFERILECVRNVQSDTGIDMLYDYEHREWVVADPAFLFLPGSVADCGLLPFAASLAAGVVVIGCRQALLISRLVIG